MQQDHQKIIFGHSPDADDAFMFYGLAKNHIQIPGHTVGHHMADIQSLNEQAKESKLPVTAISAAQYPHIAHLYRIMSCGASVGRDYGPVVVTNSGSDIPDDLEGATVAVPGRFTTSWMLFQIFGPDNFTPIFMDFDEVEDAVRSGKADAGILLHEGQILYSQRGFDARLNLGKTWFQHTQLPIPLGLDVVRRDLPQKLAQDIADALKASIEHAHKNEDDALDYALQFGRGITKEEGRRFVRMYVNQDTVDMGQEGRAALQKLFSMAAACGILTQVPPLDILQAQ